MIRLRQAAALGAAGLLMLVGGCSKSTGKVSGTVLYDGKTVVFGSVIMAGEDNEVKKAPIEKDGTYTVAGVPYGKVKVAVLSPDPTPVNPFSKMPPGLKHPSGKVLPDPPKVDTTGWFPISIDYGSLTKSGIRLTVDKPETTFNINMEAKEDSNVPPP